MTVEIGSGSLVPIASLFGLLVGSFLNVVIHRLPLGQSIAFPASHCPRCEVAIKPWHNVPVLSFVWLRGRCRECEVAIGFRYPAIELLTGVLFAAIVWEFGATIWTPLYCVFGAALVATAMIDYDHQIVPDSISLGGLVVALVLVPAAAGMSGQPWGESLQRSLLGAAIGAGVLWSVAFVHARVSVALGRRFDHWPGEGVPIPKSSEADYWLWFPGLGLGDVKLLAMIGAVVGPVGVLDTILASSLAGLVLGLAQTIGRGALGRPFGFAPAIAVGALMVLFLPRLWMLRLL